MILELSSAKIKPKPAEFRSDNNDKRGKLRRFDPNRLAARIQPVFLPVAGFAHRQVELLRIFDSKGRFLRDGFEGLGKSALQLPSLRKWLDFDERNDYF